MGSKRRTVTPLVGMLAALLVLAAGAVTARAAEEEPHWGYNCEDGAPFEWGLLSPDFAACLEGREQSPIVINTTGSSFRPLPRLRFEYQSTDLDVVNDGHTVEAHLPEGSVAGTLRVGSARIYHLERFHWHTPSEHWIDGEVFPMELHMVHEAPDGSNLVVAALIREGRANLELDKIWDHLPEHEGDEEEVADFALSRLLPRRLESYRYDGSLTTPRCVEGIRFVVFATIVEMSPQQIAKFRAIFFGNEKFPVGNARPPQPQNGRRVVTDVRP
jgi:carbonic anhydrase